MAILNYVLLATVWSREPVYSPHAPCARASLGARETRPYGREQQRIHTAVEPGAWNAFREREKMDGAGSFGAGRTGSTVDPIAFAKQPQTILRVLSWVSFSGAALYI